MTSETSASERSPLPAFLAALEAAIAAAKPTQPAAEVVRRVFGATRSEDEPPTAPADPPPVCALLDRALATARESDSPAATVAARFAALAPHLRWSRRPGS